MFGRPAFAFLLLALAAAPSAADSLSDAHRFYNAGQYEAAERAAREALKNPATANSAHLVLGRVQLERYRSSADQADLAAARQSLRDVDARALDARDRTELLIGLGEALYFEDRFGAAVEVFDTVLAASSASVGHPRERVLDWWATAMDRLAQSRSPADRAPVYDRIIEKTSAELASDPASTPGAYWIVAASRSRGDLDRALDLATAAWVRAPLARDRGAALRADVDRLVKQAILPERAARLQVKDRGQALTGMLNEWEAFKANWTR
jgi:tetratricopeptide (TPR) repeat protein